MQHLVLLRCIINKLFHNMKKQKQNEMLQKNNKQSVVLERLTHLRKYKIIGSTKRRCYGRKEAKEKKKET